MGISHCVSSRLTSIICKGAFFTSIYNDELARLKKEYGESAKGTVSYQQIQSDVAAGVKKASAESVGSTVDYTV